MFTVLDKTCKVTMRFNCNTQICENVFFVHNDSEWTEAMMTSLIGEVVNWEGSTANLYRTQTCVLQNVFAVDQSAPDSIGVETTVSIAGTYGANPLPNNVTLAIKLATGLTGRRHRGRMYWVGLDDGQLTADSDNQQIGPDRGADIVVAVNNLIGTMIPLTAGSGMVIAHRREGHVVLPVGTTTPVVGCDLTDYNLDSQRRRLPAHNRHR